MGLLNKQTAKVVSNVTNKTPKHIPGQVAANAGNKGWEAFTNAVNILGTGGLLAGFLIPSADVRKREKLLKRQEQLAAEGKLYMPIEPPEENKMEAGSMRDIQPPEYKDINEVSRV